MTAIVVTMLFVVVVAVASLAFASFTHRGRPLPGPPWLGELVDRVVESVPVVEDGDLDPVEPREPSRR